MNSRDTGLKCGAPSHAAHFKPITKLICYIVVVVLVLGTASDAHSISVKTQGKLALAVILGGVAILTKYLGARDQQAVEALHAKLGRPERVVTFERGFDQWRIEWYGDRRYVFRNNILEKETGAKSVQVPKSF